jgi:hypothetical protein
MSTESHSEPASAAADAAPRAVVELRQYTLHPGRRDELIELFEREFIESQEATGMRLLGTFCDCDDPNRFVWLRAFSSMSARAQALADFYDGPIWKEHRFAAVATMIDSDDVLLLRPASSHAEWPIEDWRRDLPSAHEGGLVAVVCGLTSAADARFADRFAMAMQPLLARAGGSLAACWITESSANTFPRLPVREGETVIVWLARFDRIEASERFAAELKTSMPWIDSIGSDERIGFKGAAQVLRLAPTRRSRF